MPAAVTEYPEHTEVSFFMATVLVINDGSGVVVMNVAVPGASTDWTGFTFQLKFIHVGVEKRFFLAMGGFLDVPREEMLENGYLKITYVKGFTEME